MTGRRINPDHVLTQLERTNRYAAAHPEKVKETKRRTKLKNREHVNAYNREYLRTYNKEKLRALRHKWYEAHKEEVNRKAREWDKAHPGYRTTATEIRRQRLKGGKRITVKELDQRWEYFGGLCWMCNKPATEWDHVKPVAKGGVHMLCNLRPACSPCNRSKHAKWPLGTLRKVG